MYNYYIEYDIIYENYEIKKIYKMYINALVTESQIAVLFDVNR